MAAIALEINRPETEKEVPLSRAPPQSLVDSAPATAFRGLSFKTQTRDSQQEDEISRSSAGSYRPPSGRHQTN